jgi:hypothetical protein
MDISGFIGWINTNSGALSFFATVLMVIVTIVYVMVTKKILESSKQQMSLMQNPIIGITIDDMGIMNDDSRNLHCFSVEFTLVNLGTSPALQIYWDVEIKLKYSGINGENVIPQSDGPAFYPFLIANATTKDDCGISHYGTFLRYLTQNFQKQYESNMERLKSAQEPEYDAVSLRVHVYYKNNLNQHFKSYFETDIVNESPLISNEFYDSQNIKITPIDLPQQKFSAIFITEKEKENEISSRNSKREKLKNEI